MEHFLFIVFLFAISLDHLQPLTQNQNLSKNVLKFTSFLDFKLTSI